jgi:serine/threonine-protein kinase RsbT
MDADQGRTFHIHREFDSIWCSTECAGYALSRGFDKRAAGEIAIAVSELVTNIIKFAGSGVVTIRPLAGPSRGVEVRAVDHGPGIDNIEAALRDGYSEGRLLSEEETHWFHRGLGMGLGAVKRLMDTLEIRGNPEGGLTIVAGKLLPRRPSWEH